MIGSFASSATASQVAINGKRKLSQTFEELEGSNLESNLINHKPITGTVVCRGERANIYIKSRKKTFSCFYITLSILMFTLSLSIEYSSFVIIC